jgi:hypothetical protein
VRRRGEDAAQQAQEQEQRNFSEFLHFALPFSQEYGIVYTGGILDRSPPPDNYAVHYIARPDKMQEKRGASRRQAGRQNQRQRKQTP